MITKFAGCGLGFYAGKRTKIEGGGRFLALTSKSHPWAKRRVRLIFPLIGLKLSTLVHDKNVYLIQPERANTGMRQLKSRL